MRLVLPTSVLSILLLLSSGAAAQPLPFVNGLRIPGNTIDATNQPGANAGRFGNFSDIYYDPNRHEWWALSDRGPGGGLIDYGTRLQRFTIDVHPISGAISNFRIRETVKLRDFHQELTAPIPPVGDPRAMNGLNPALLNNNAGVLGRSFDPEGLVIDPRTGHFIVSDEYGPSVYEFSRSGRLVGVFQVPDHLAPRPNGSVVDYVAGRIDVTSGSGRQDNRGYEGLAITPDGKKLFAILQDPLLNEGPPGGTGDDNDGRQGRNLRIVEFDNDWWSPNYRMVVHEYAYRLEAQASLIARIAGAGGGVVAPNDIRQGRNIGVSAIVALNNHQFLVIERDNRGIGVENPQGIGPGAPTPLNSMGVVGSKRVYKIDIDGATDVLSMDLPDSNGDLAGFGIVPVQKNDADVFIDFVPNPQLPNGNWAEKWEGLTIGPRLLGGGYMILAGTDNDYSVTQLAGPNQFDVYVDFKGNFYRCLLDQPTMCELNPPNSDTVIDNPVSVAGGYSLLPGLLHSYRASPSVMADYVRPKHWILSLFELLSGFHLTH